MSADVLLTRTTAELRALWAERFPRREPPPHREVLLRELAWTMQRVGAGLDAATARRLEAVVRGVTRADRDARNSHPTSKRPRTTAPAHRPELTHGARLVRTWNGHDHTVDVLGPRAFRYNGTTYASLSEVARIITGARWSGPRFFGLARRTSKATHP